MSLAPVHPRRLADVKVASSLLYGIFVSERSYWIGCRSLVNRKHVDMLASKVTRRTLPQELVDLVADHLFDLEMITVKAMWNAKVDINTNRKKFIIGSDKSTPAERRAFEILVCSPQTSVGA